MAALGVSEPELLLKAAEQDPQKIAVLGQRIVREITEKFQSALQSLHSMDVLSEQPATTQEQEKLLSFEQQVGALYSLVFTIRSAYERCLEAGSKRASRQSASLVDERDRLLKVNACFLFRSCSCFWRSVCISLTLACLLGCTASELCCNGCITGELVQVIFVLFSWDWVALSLSTKEVLPCLSWGILLVVCVMLVFSCAV